MKDKTDRKRSHNYSQRFMRAHPNLVALGLYDLEQAYRAGLRMGRKLEREAK